ncbi:MAG TPA: ATP-binding cassette domain-containing protein [Fibrobacter sp.]|nr:ATP-binding cassette domain-containing protein [Fibrobacter sp.]
MVFGDIESLLKKHSQVQVIEAPSENADAVLWAFLKKQEQLSVVSEQIQRKIQRALAPFWQHRFISLEDTEAPLVGHFLLSASFFLQTSLMIEDTPFPKTNPSLLPEALQAASLPASVLDRTLLSLSNGELRRVLLARVWMENPKWIYFNDVFGGLDSEYRPSLRESVLKMALSGVNMVIRLAREEEILPKIPVFIFKDNQFNFIENAFASGAPEKTHQANPRASLDYKIEVLHAPSVQGEVLFDLKNTHVRFGKTDIIKELNWRVCAGEHWAIMGANGAGKSTLLAMLSADHPQIYRNEIILLGKRPGKGLDVWAHKAKMGFFSPEMALQYREDLNIQEVLCTGYTTSLGLFQEPVFEERQKANHWLSALGFKNPKAPFSSLTLIEKRLILIARAAIRPPLVLILDEPTQGMDADHRFRVFDLLNFLAPTTTIILVSHYESEWPACMTHLLRLPKIAMPV